MTVGVSVEKRMALTRPKHAAGQLSVRLLGEIRVQRGDEAVVLPASKRTRGLLGFLVATATTHSRQALCDLLWEGPDDPRAALRWSLTKLRPLVNDAGFEHLIADREHVSFSPGKAQVDTGRISELLGETPEKAILADLEEASALLQGEFLDGLDLPSCYRFHHWCLAERERWGALRQRILSRVLERLGDDPDRALPYARAMVAADPLSELSHGRLVGLLAKLGRRRDAQEHYAYARDMIQREMGAALVGELRPPAAVPHGGKPMSSDKNESQPIVQEPVAGSAHPSERKLVGRLNEKQTILAALDALNGSDPSGALLFLGELGIGKSRLLEFTAALAAKKGFRVLSARCFEAEAVRPYGCWADALGLTIAEFADDSIRRDLALFLPRHEISTNDEGSRTRLFAAVATLLSSIAKQQPLVLIIDDLQWIDEGSSSLLHYILRASDRPQHFLFVGAARADEMEDNPWCKRVVSALAQDGTVKRMKLSPLQASEAAQFFEGNVDSDYVAVALKESGGNPLFLTEMASADQQGRQSSGHDLDALISDRIARLNNAERDLLIFASATARDFKPELLGAAMELPELQLLERIDQLERRGFLKSGGDGRLYFTHDLIRQTTYRSLSQSRRRLIHRQIARALNDAAQRDPSLAGELAFHAGAAGDHALAVQASIAAGEHGLRLFANRAALDMADRGLGHLAQLPPDSTRARSHLALLKVKVFASASPGIRMKPEVFEELQQSVEAAELMGVQDYDAALGWHMISWWNQQSNNTSKAQQAILRAELLTRPLDELTRVQQLANTGRCLLEVEGDVERARSFLREAEEIAIRLEKSFVELDWGRGLVARWDGDLVAAQESMRRALMLARLRQDRWREMECLVWIAKIAIEIGQTGEVASVCDEIDAIAARIGDGPAPVADALRTLALMQSKTPDAAHHLNADLAALRKLDDKAQLAYILNQVAIFHFDNGNLKDANIAATEALAAAQAVNRNTEVIVANSILANALTGVDRKGKSGGNIDAMLRSQGDLSLLSARARTYLQRAQKEFEIPTPAQTPGS
jgi:DNA-binding SARP family transcriptional activator